MRQVDTIATRARDRYGMEEQEYLLDRANRGWSARRIARELGFSHAAVQVRMNLLTEKRFLPKERRAA